MNIIKKTLYIVIAIVTVANNAYGAQKKIAKPQEGLSLASDESYREYRLSAAGVLPIVYNEDHKQMTVILGRQTFVDRVNKGKYDYFAGVADKEDNGNSILTAAREWWEEARLEEILKWDLNKTQKFLTKNVKGYIILATHNLDTEKNFYGVMYLVDIGQEKRDKLFEKCESSYKATLQKQEYGVKGLSAFLEKDKFIEVKWDELFTWIRPQHGKLKKLIPVKMSRAELPDNTIELRPILTTLLKGKTEHNVFQGPTEDLPLGVFIFATQKKGTDYGMSVVLLGEKKNLNEMVINHLNVQKEFAKKAAAIEAMQQQKQNNPPIKTNEKASQPAENPQEGTNPSVVSPVTPEKPVAAATPQTSTSVSQKVESDQTSDQPNNELSFFSRVLTSFGETIVSGFQAITGFVNAIFDFIGRGFPS